MPHPTTSRDLLEFIADFTEARRAGDADALQDIAQRFDVALGRYFGEYSSVQNEA